MTKRELIEFLSNPDIPDDAPIFNDGSGDEYARTRATAEVAVIGELGDGYHYFSAKDLKDGQIVVVIG